MIHVCYPFITCVGLILFPDAFCFTSLIWTEVLVLVLLQERGGTDTARAGTVEHSKMELD